MLPTPYGRKGIQMDKGLTRYALTLTGVVQGVGMRPHVAKVARECQVTGWCGNNDIEVFIEAQAPREVLDHFLATLMATLPPLAQVVDVVKQNIPVREETGFTIVASTHIPGARTLIPPDVAPCEDCLREFHDPTNRRYHYPFITCTNCGPRLSIIEQLPYDRPATTLKVFDMCPACAKEYSDPNDRRYHAQPISCPDCGPHLWFERAGAPQTGAAPVERNRTQQAAAAIAAACETLRAGKVVAMRGIGGFHLLVDATNPLAIARLRERKHRPHKPFAVMVPTLADAHKAVTLTPAEQHLLVSPARPIVIAAATGYLPEEIAPGLGEVGVVLPYSPLHHLLLEEFGRPVVATSGNPSGEPLVASIPDARALLGDFCDGFLLHDRDIVVPVEDSVFMGTTPVRRSRGLAPLPVPIPDPTGEVAEVFAVGGELKNTMCLTSGNLGHLSSHIGDMGSLRAQEVLERTFAQMTSMRAVRPEAIVCDLHPGYSTTSWAQRLAERLDVELIQVQHHHAHAASVLAEHRLVGTPAVVIAADGTGYGTDGHIWGGEIFGVDENLTFTRAWHVPEFPLIGGDRAVTHPWRIAAGIQAAYGLDDAHTFAAFARVADRVNPAELALVQSQLTSGFGTVATSSLGRIFDAAAALAGCADKGQAVTYEAQAAMEFEHLARTGTASPDDTTSIEHAFVALARGVVKGNLPDAARQFHRHIAQILGQEAVRAATQVDTNVIAITGGCALNRILVGDLADYLGAHGYCLLRHELIPPGDGGLSLGQAVLARAAKL